jgi:SLT domain-containing protein
MNKLIRNLLPVMLLASPALSYSYENGAGATSERIYFIQEDGRHAIVYTTSRSEYSSYSLWFGRQNGLTPDKYLDNFHYLYPT